MNSRIITSRYSQVRKQKCWKLGNARTRKRNEPHNLFSDSISSNFCFVASTWRLFLQVLTKLNLNFMFYYFFNSIHEKFKKLQGLWVNTKKTKDILQKLENLYRNHTGRQAFRAKLPMGNAQSPPSDPQYASASRAFTQRELEDLRTLFKSLAIQSQSNGEYVSLSVFQSYFGLNGPLGGRMFDLVTQQRKDKKLTFEDLVVAKAAYEKGTKDEIEEFIFGLLDVSGDNILGRCDLESVLTEIFNNILCIKSSEVRSSSHQDIVNIFLNAATFSKHDEGCSEEVMSFEDFRSWCTHLPSVRKLLGSLLMPPDSGRPGSQVPHLLHSESIDSNVILLRKDYAWHIGGALSQQELEEWKLLYHSALNGLSFNTFLGNISNHDGPTVLIIKDKEGYIYGGYASQPWERHADFYGDMKCYLFQLNPKASIFRPTGANNNLQWCAANFTSEDIPNGIGFGGRVNHFGLFLSANFDKGHTFSCSTFGSPCLSKTNHICPEVIECWGVTQGAVQGRNEGVKGTILERFKEDRHMLNMVGLANSSE